MKSAYSEEVSRMSTSLEACKMELETWYSKRYQDKDIVGAVKETYDQLMAHGDNELTAYNAAIKPIRNAMEPHLNYFMFVFLNVQDSNRYIIYIYSKF